MRRWSKREKFWGNSRHQGTISVFCRDLANTRYASDGMIRGPFTPPYCATSRPQGRRVSPLTPLVVAARFRRGRLALWAALAYRRTPNMAILTEASLTL
jgi:hypothetical protein